jgi:DNA-binding GntR family transcriptional regulator
MTRSSSPSRHRLANQILDFMRHARVERGRHLREQPLGDLFGVSRTPVRVALERFAAQCVVEARRDRGFFLARPFDALYRLEIEALSSADHQLYKRLVGDRLSGAISDSLTHNEVERRYGFDRLVAQRALARLAEDGLIERNQGCGWTFGSTLDSVASLRASCDFRLALEPAAFRLPNFRVDSVALERVRRQHLSLISHPDIAAVDSRRLFAADAVFHEMIAEFSGNARVLRAIRQQNRLRRLLEFSGCGDRRRVREPCREHLAVIDAIVDGDLDSAAEAMRRHLSQAFAAAPPLAGSRKRPRRRRSAAVEA